MQMWGAPDYHEEPCWRILTLEKNEFAIILIILA